MLGKLTKRGCLFILLFLLPLVSLSQTKSLCKKSILLLSAEVDAPACIFNTIEACDSLINPGAPGRFYLNLALGKQSVNLLLNEQIHKLTQENNSCGLSDKQKPFHISINQLNQILFDTQLISLDSLASELDLLYQKVGKDSSYALPATIDQLYLAINWQTGCSTAVIEEVLKTICFAHIKAVENKEGVEICKRSKKEIKALKEKYPLHIMFIRNESLGTLEEIIIIEIPE